MKISIQVLLIEDNEDDALLVEKELKHSGYRVHCERVETAEDMKKALSQKEWDCIISDYSMPHFNGLAALLELQAMGLDIPFILVSGTIGEDIAVAAMQAGANDYIMKGQLQRLIPAVERELREADNRRLKRQAEISLRKLYQAIEHTDEIIFMTDVDGTITYINPAFEKIYGYCEEEILEKTPRILKSGLISQEYYAQFWKDILSGKSLSAQYINKTKDGRLLHIEGSVSPIFGPDGVLTGFIAVQKDISERKLAEESVIRAKEEWEKTFDAVPDLISIIDENFRIIRVNKAMANRLGKTHEKCIGLSCCREVHGTDEPPLFCPHKQLLVDMIEHKAEVHIDKWNCDLEISVSPLFNEKKELIGSVHLARDITERKRAEEKLRQSEEQFRLITENVADMIAVLDTEGKRLYNSPSYKKILGDPEKLRGTDSFQEIHPEDRDKIRKIFQETVKTGIGQRSEFRFLRKNGEIRYIESQGSVIRDKDGKVSQVVVVSRDVTEQKQLEQQFLRAQRMESIGTLAGGIAHDLNNVLAPIMMGVEILRKKFPYKESEAMIDTMEKSAKRGADIVKQVLVFARGEEGEHVPIKPKYIVDEIVKISQETFPKNIQIREDIPKDLWMINADPTQMHQVMLNTFVNARDAMPNGGILTISAENIRLDEHYARMHIGAKPGAYVLISIADTGIGIPPEILNRIFEPFFTTKGIGKGTGLGLSTVQSIIKSHGGFINVYSEKNKGSTFKFYIPAQIKNHVVDEGEKQSKHPFGKGELVLVVDDEASIREITKETLSVSGYNVLTACDGAEAIAVYAENKSNIDVVLTDMMMPIMDGTTTIRAMRKMNPDVKIIAASGMIGGGDSMKSLEIPVSAFLTKPYNAEKLLTLLQKVLAGQ